MGVVIGRTLNRWVMVIISHQASYYCLKPHDSIGT